MVDSVLLLIEIYNTGKPHEFGEHLIVSDRVSVPHIRIMGIANTVYKMSDGFLRGMPIIFL